MGVTLFLSYLSFGEKRGERRKRKGQIGPLPPLSFLFVSFISLPALSPPFLFFLERNGKEEGRGRIGKFNPLSKERRGCRFESREGVIWKGAWDARRKR